MKELKSLIITGTSRGLGSSLAKVSLRYNYAGYFGLSRFNGLDISNSEIVEKYFSDISNVNFEDIQKPRLLINNAGICVNKSILETTPEEWQKQININLNGAYYCSREFIKFCIKHKLKGKIVNICSTAGTGVRPGRAGYAASKAALINFSMSMNEEIKSYGMKVYCICPGAFDSNMRHEIAPDDDFSIMLKPDNIANEVFKIIDILEYSNNQIIYIKE